MPYDVDQASQDASPIRTIPNDYSHYKPINSDQKEIRILVLHPSNDPNSPLICSLVRADLNTDAPCYEAISYCWGDLDDTTTVSIRHLEADTVLRHDKLIISDHGQQSSFYAMGKNSKQWTHYQITKTLHNALLQFRFSDRPRFLWADAICINQGDTTERSHQVQLMRSVYGAASQVLVWLDGPSSSEFDALEFLQNCLLCLRSLAKIGDVTWKELAQLSVVAASLRDFWQNLKSFSSSNKHETEPKVSIEPITTSNRPDSNRKEEEVDHAAYSTLYNALLGLSEIQEDRNLLGEHYMNTSFRALNIFIRGQKWFERIWVLQEVGSNGHVYLHHRNGSVAWESLEAAVIIYRILLRYTDQPVYSLKLPRAWSSIAPGNYRYSLPLVELLVSSSFFQAADSRDRIFAQLGLMTEIVQHDELPSLIRPDYSKPVGQIFREFTYWVISSHKSLAILSLAQNSNRKTVSANPTSTWVPNYARTTSRVARTFGLYSQYCASRLSKPRICQQNTDGAISLEGFQVQTVSSVTDIASYSTKPSHAFKHQLWLSQLLPRPNTTTTLRADAKWIGESRSRLVRFFRCLGCTTTQDSIWSNNRLLRTSISHRTANINFAHQWFSFDPKLEGLTWSQKLYISRLSHRHRQEHVNRADKMISNSVHGRRFFTTPDDDFGLCPSGTQADDIIVILYGGQTPYVLRENPYPDYMSLADQLKQGPTYTFVGECFLEKYMYGSAMDQVGFAEEGLQRYEYQRKVFTLV